MSPIPQECAGEPQGIPEGWIPLEDAAREALFGWIRAVNTVFTEHWPHMLIKACPTPDMTMADVFVPPDTVDRFRALRRPRSASYHALTRARADSLTARWVRSTRRTVHPWKAIP